ncbi:MAG TPA: hypothetical protein VNV62_27925 [Trebonia sp.]|nr:hypothetical protein [Trebonia sp.]
MRAGQAEAVLVHGVLGARGPDEVIEVAAETEPVRDRDFVCDAPARYTTNTSFVISRNLDVAVMVTVGPAAWAGAIATS